MIPRPTSEPALPIYLRRAERFQVERPLAAGIAQEVRQALKTYPLSLAGIEFLRQRAADRIWYAPRSAWALAQIAYAATAETTNLYAVCALTLGGACSALGEFAEAIPLLDGAEQYFLAHGQFDYAARSACELAALYAEMGELEQAEAALARARSRPAGVEDAMLNAHCDRAEGRFCFEKNRHAEAAAAFRRAAETFSALGLSGEAAVTWCALAEAFSYLDRQAAPEWVEHARRVSPPEPDAIHGARCDYARAWIYSESNQFQESLELVHQAQIAFTREGMTYRAALCDLCRGIAHYRLDQFEEAWQACGRAKAEFVARRLDSHVARCDFNLAVVAYYLNRYDEALALYEQVMASASSEGRVLRVARCYTNMGLCYDRLGRYDRAVYMHARARQKFLEAGNPVSAARCQEHLAGTYRRLGRYAEALQHGQDAREVFVRHQLHVDVAWCDVYLADLYLATGDDRAALTCLTRAHSAFEMDNIPVQAAACEREMARAFTRLAQAGAAHASLDAARAVFQASGLAVDVALCDLARGEVYLDQSMLVEAAGCFKSALETLRWGFPDEAWRAEYGLGHCALIEENRPQALGHWLSAVHLIHSMRATLPTERLSGGFFADRRELYEATLALAVTLEQRETALAIAEAAKAQAFLNRVGDARQVGALADPHAAQLHKRELQLRREIAALRNQLRLIQPDPGGPILRGVDEVLSDQPAALSRLAQLAREYETIVEQLRLTAAGRPDAASLPLFSMESLRAALRAYLSARWACLTYYLLGDQLVIFYLDAAHLVLRVKPLTVYDRHVLEQCTDPDPDVRELIYAEAGGGQPQLRHLHELLIPPEIEALGADDVLLIAPHAQLHRLPFHALCDDQQTLAAQVPTILVPSLSALEALLQRSRTRPGIERALAVGVADFDARARHLPDARAEIEMLQALFGQRVTVLWQAEATREAMLGMQRAGELAGYDVIHFATHVRLDHAAPSQSSILLYDDDLAFADILTLGLHAKLVVLSSCEGALGESYAGDEIVGLAQGFFHAGAQAVVASLWPVEDAATRELMQRLYRRLAAGADVAHALRSAQREMAAAGYAPYHWAPFVVIGLP